MRLVRSARAASFVPASAQQGAGMQVEYPSKGKWGVVVRLRGRQFVNATPKWDLARQVRSIKFDGRATEVSVKNFKLVELDPESNTPADSNRFSLRFGKVGKDAFNLDYRSPLSTTEAAAIALTSFERKSFFVCAD